MGEEKAFSDRLLEALGDLVPEDQKEALRTKAEKVAQESMEGFEQLKEDIAKMAGGVKKSADQTLKSLEEAFIDFQSSVDQMNDRRRLQVEEVCSRLGLVLERLSESNIGQQLRNKLEKKAEAILEAVRKSEEQLTKDVMDQLEDLAQSVNDVTDKESKEIKAAMADVMEAVASTEKTPT